MTGDDFMELLAPLEASRSLDGLASILFVSLVVTCGIIVVIDARERIIPDACNAVVAALGLIFASQNGAIEAVAAALQGSIAFLVFWAFRALYRALRGRHGLGFGDVKFLGAAGTWVGLGGLPPLILVACAAALAFLGLGRLRGHHITAGLALPFGPFLVAGLFGVLALRFA